MECDCCVLSVLTHDPRAIRVHCYVCSNTAEQIELQIKKKSFNGHFANVDTQNVQLLGSLVCP